MSFTYESYNEQHAKNKRDPYNFKRNRNFIAASSDEDGTEHDSSSEHDVNTPRVPATKPASTAQQPARSRKRARVQPKWIVTARVTNLASNDDGSEADRVQQKLKDVDAHVLQRIKKAITLAGHAGTGEAEARNAMRMAHKLMQAHNVSQADVMAQESDEQRAKAGSSVVEIRTRSSEDDEEGSVVFSGWYDTGTTLLLSFRNNAAAIADKFLEKQNMKLYSGRARATAVPLSESGKEAYTRGRRDGRTIEVKRKRIGNAA